MSSLYDDFFDAIEHDRALQQMRGTLLSEGITEITLSFVEFASFYPNDPAIPKLFTSIVGILESMNDRIKNKCTNIFWKKLEYSSPASQLCGDYKLCLYKKEFQADRLDRQENLPLIIDDMIEMSCKIPHNDSSSLSYKITTDILDMIEILAEIQPEEARDILQFLDSDDIFPPLRELAQEICMMPDENMTRKSETQSIKKTIEDLDREFSFYFWHPYPVPR